MSEDAGPDARSDDAEPGGRPCPICEAPMYHRHCKYVCPNHGVIMDCADTFY
ncbi:HVO_2523 family zinc finger protein [Halorussus sp. AFM4]|uniref:HVO_2523 family zinc finger protein n=1 Tax=Halorussus sp. AFM4 TaxID=3421651 RepID=UPI003EC00382